MANSTEQTAKRKTRRTVSGVVVSAHKTPNTIRVKVEYRIRHAFYGKYIRRRTTVHAHDAKGEAKQGDLVEVMECRPVSKTKSWRLVKVLRAGPGN